MPSLRVCHRKLSNLERGDNIIKIGVESDCGRADQILIARLTLESTFAGLACYDVEW